MGRVLVLGLDGFEPSLADTMIASGSLPSLARIREKSARFLLDHGSARETGLAWEHVSSGLSPEDAERWSAISFDKNTYGVVQEGPLFDPFPSRIAAKSVVFDFPYFDLLRARGVQGAVSWGAHDSGTDFCSNPSELGDEILEQHGDYPARDWIYAFAWPSSDRCRRMGDALADGVALRSRIAQWLLAERFPDWELALIGVSESHSVLEGLWHGVDTGHPLNSHASSRAAAEGIQKVYRAIDRLVGTLTEQVEDATILLFSMHGMGANRSDVPSMVLLPELLHRHAFGRPLFEQPESWSLAADGVPILGQEENWTIPFPHRKSMLERARSALSRVFRRHNGQTPGGGPASERRRSLDWMPAARYQPLWHKMPAFALPSFYDGQIRINLQGREREGVVPLERYETFCEEIRQTLKDCRDPFSGECAVESIHITHGQEPLSLAASGADLYVSWKENLLCLEHPDLGRVGPVPFRRTGGHTGLHGMAYLKSNVLVPGDYGIRSSFDVVPTLFDLFEDRLPERISGHSLTRSVGSCAHS